MISRRKDATCSVRGGLDASSRNSTVHPSRCSSTNATAEAWRHSHNFIHHTYTNILGKDKDLGYEIMRIDPAQSWHPVYLLQPFYNILLAWLFEWGVAFHDMDFEAIRSGEKSMDQVRQDLKGIAGKARAQILKDYVAWPLISALVMTGIEFVVFGVREEAEKRSTSPKMQARRAARRLQRKRASSGRNVIRQLVERKSFREPFRRTVQANVVANLMRNMWAYAIIFCGHFPDQTYHGPRVRGAGEKDAPPVGTSSASGGE